MGGRANASLNTLIVKMRFKTCRSLQEYPSKETHLLSGGLIFWGRCDRKKDSRKN
jgi:hypothetical protein